MEQRYTDKHPSVQKAKSELQQLQGSLDSEVVASVDSNAATLNPTQSELLKGHALAAVNFSVAKAEAESLKELRSKKEGDVGSMPDDLLEYMRLDRDAKIKSEVYLNLVKQNEQSKVQEAMDSMDIQIVDRADLPEYPVFPSKKLFVLVGFALGCLLSFGYGLLVCRH